MATSRLTIRSPARDVALAALFAALTAAGAYVSFPLYGAVPFSLQVLVVLLAGLVLGARLGALSMAAYLLLGLVAPVYAGGTTGMGVLLGPAGGYLWGFVAAAALTGAVAERLHRPTFWRLAGAAAAGLIPIYALGAAWLAVSLGSADPSVILWAGVAQFLPGDVLKVAAAALAVRALMAAPVRLPAIPPGRGGSGR
jgi:biotin transport system substrate-specific component